MTYEKNTFWEFENDSVFYGKIVDITNTSLVIAKLKYNMPSYYQHQVSLVKYDLEGRSKRSEKDPRLANMIEDPDNVFWSERVSEQ